MKFKILSLYFIIVEILAIYLYVTKDISTKLFLLFTMLSIGMLLLPKLNKNE